MKRINLKLRDKIKQSLKGLPLSDKKKEIISFVYGLDDSVLQYQSEAAKKFGCSKTYISDVIREVNELIALKEN